MAWSAEKNAAFFDRMQRYAVALDDLFAESQRLENLWFAESVSGDPAFVDHGGNTTADITSMITMAQHYQLFIDNGVVPQADREPIITRVGNAVG